MSARTDGEKKGLDKVTPEILLGQEQTLRLLTQIQGTSPKAVKFEINRKPVLADITNPSNMQDTETIAPASFPLKETIPVKLTRVEIPLSFDVVTLTRKIAEEEKSISQTQFEAAGNDEEDEGDEYEGGEVEYGDED